MSKPTDSAATADAVNYWLFLLPPFFLLLAVANLFTLGIFIGAPLYLLGDLVPRLFLPPFHSEGFMEVAIFMGTAWSLAASAISFAYVLHNGVKAWSGRKILSFALLLLALDIGLSAHFHKGAVSREARHGAAEPRR